MRAYYTLILLDALLRRVSSVRLLSLLSLIHSQ